MMTDTTDLTLLPEYMVTLNGLEKMKRRSAKGTDYWMGREIAPVLGYPVWARFEPVIERAMAACDGAGIARSHHFARTSKMMGIGKGAMVEGTDYFLTRAAAYLIAMNGDPSKTEIAAAQAYFAAQTRRMELEDQLAGDEKRLEMREKATRSAKRVSRQAQIAGVRDTMQGVFHDQRYRGLYGKPKREVNLDKGLGEEDNLLDRAGALELSAHDFQMNLAADVIERERILGEQKAIDKNLAIARRVRQTMIDEKATMPENLPLEVPIKEVQRRVEAQKRRQLRTR